MVKTVAKLPNDHFLVGDIACGEQGTTVRQYDKNGILIDSTSIYLEQNLERCPEISSIQHVKDDQIIVGGSFSSINSFSEPSLLKVSLKGEVDEFFKYDIEGLVNQFINFDSTHLIVVGNFNRIANERNLFGLAIIDINFPDAPFLNCNFSKKKSTNVAVDLNWSGNSDVKGYSLERSVNNDPYVKISETTTNYYKDNDVIADKKYSYRVKSYNENGSSSYSNIIKVEDGQIVGVIDTKSTEYQIFPTFGNGIFSIKNQSNDNIERLRVFNVGGLCVLDRNINSQICELEKIDISLNSNGIYFIAIQGKGNAKVLKYIKNK